MNSTKTNDEQAGVNEEVGKPEYTDNPSPLLNDAIEQHEDPKILAQRAKQEENAAITDAIDSQQEHLDKAQAIEEKLTDPKEPTKTYTHEELRDALYWIHMIFEWANMTMVLIKQTGEAAHTQGKLSGDGIHLAVRQLEWDSGARGVIDSSAQYADWTDELVTYTANNGVPVFVHVCPDDYCISSPDTVLYEHEYVKLPNPFGRFAEVFPNV